MGVDPASLVLLGGYDSRIIHSWFHGGKGPESTTDANYEEWLALSELHEKPYQLIQDAVWESGASWEGQAAEAARAAVAPMAQWVADTKQASYDTCMVVAGQSGAFRRAKEAVPQPPTVPDKPWYNDFVPWDTDYDEALAAKQSADAAAVQALVEYMAASTETMNNMPQFVEPDEVQENTKQPNAESSTVNNSSTVSPQSRGGGSYGGSYTSNYSSPVTPAHRSAVSSASVTPIPNTPPSSSTPWAAGGVCWRRCRARGCRSRACSCAGSSMSVVGV